MSAGTWDALVDQGSTFNQTLEWRDPAGALINLTGYTARMHVRETYESADPPVLALSTENGGITLGGAAGTIVLLATAAQMAAVSVSGQGIPPRKDYVYDLELVSGAGAVTRILQGKFTVTREVTR